MSTEAIQGMSGDQAFDVAAYAGRLPAKTLGESDFLLLLTTQMSHQDPTNPQKDTDFIAQMATFSSLENSRAIRADQELIKANSLLGRTVEVRASGQTATSGVVTAVHVEAGRPRVEVNGERYALEELLMITPTQVTEPTE